MDEEWEQKDKLDYYLAQIAYQVTLVSLTKEGKAKLKFEDFFYTKTLPEGEKAANQPRTADKAAVSKHSWLTWAYSSKPKK